MKLAICNETYAGWEHARVCADVAAAGYDGLELSLSAIEPDPSTITEARAERLGAEARTAGLEVVGLHWLLVAPPGLHLASPDAAVRARTIAYMQHLARLCAAAGGHVMVLGSPAQRSVPDGATHADTFARVAEGCRAVAETAALCGVALALEPLAPRLTDVMQTCAEALRMIELVDHPACRLHLDACAMSTEARSALEIVTACAVELVHVHVNDPTTMGGPGSGTHDQRPLLRALRSVDYDGYLSVEVFVRNPDGPRIARDSAAYLRAALAEN
jgi:sugar phosphate isomerase/epimerase